MRCSRRPREAQSCQPIFECHTAVLPRTSRLQEEHKNYKIDSTDDKKKDQKNLVEKKTGRKGPFSTGGLRLYKKWPYVGRLSKLERGKTKKRGAFGGGGGEGGELKQRHGWL